jgi:hypothetical protein
MPQLPCGVKSRSVIAAFFIITVIAIIVSFFFHFSHFLQYLPFLFWQLIKLCLEKIRSIFIDSDSNILNLPALLNVHMGLGATGRSFTGRPNYLTLI